VLGKARYKLHNLTTHNRQTLRLRSSMLPAAITGERI